MEINNLKQEFINSFGEEKWNLEEALDKIRPISKQLAAYLDVNELPIVSEQIEEDSRMMFKDEYIILRNDIALNYVEALKAIAHEYRHFYQYTCIREKRTNEPLMKFYIEDFIKINSTGYNPFDQDSYFSLIIELDAFAFQKYYLDKFLNIKTSYPNKIYDEILNNFIKKYF